MRKRVLIATMACFMLTGCSSGVSSKAAEYSSQAADYSSQAAEMANKYYDEQKENRTLKSQADSIKYDFNKYKESMKEYEGLAAAEADARKIEAESMAAAESIAMESSKAAEEQAKQASKEAEEAAKAAEEAKGYETGITYNQLARTPDDYTGQKVKFRGKVIQVLEGDRIVQIRLAVNKDYNTIIYGEYAKSIVPTRVLENDVITIYGTSDGLLSYKSTIGGTITIPSVKIDKIDQ